MSKEKTKWDPTYNYELKSSDPPKFSIIILETIMPMPIVPPSFTINLFGSS